MQGLVELVDRFSSRVVFCLTYLNGHLYVYILMTFFKCYSCGRSLLCFCWTCWTEKELVMVVTVTVLAAIFVRPGSSEGNWIFFIGLFNILLYWKNSSFNHRSSSALLLLLLYGIIQNSVHIHPRRAVFTCITGMVFVPLWPDQVHTKDYFV